MTGRLFFTLTADCRVSLAKATLEGLLESNSICLFATHYRDVADIRVAPPSSLKYMSFLLDADRPVFQYKLADGVSPSSFAMSVAKSAGMADDIIADSMLGKSVLDGSIGCINTDAELVSKLSRVLQLL